MLSYWEWFEVNPEYHNTESRQVEAKDIDIGYLSYCVDCLSLELEEITGSLAEWTHRVLEKDDAINTALNDMAKRLLSLEGQVGGYK